MIEGETRGHKETNELREYDEDGVGLTELRSNPGGLREEGSDSGKGRKMN